MIVVAEAGALVSVSTLTVEEARAARRLRVTGILVTGLLPTSDNDVVPESRPFQPVTIHTPTNQRDR